MQQRLLMLATIVGIVGVVAGTVIIAGRFFMSRPPAPLCLNSGMHFTDVIENDALSLAQINGKLCDTLTIMNNDPKIRVIAFGPHDHHITYDGVTEKVLGESQSFTITFDKAGTYTFHDHDDESVKATFTVSR